MYDPYATLTKNVLANGLEVHSVYCDRPWVIVEIVVHAGSREDPVEMPGLAHFVEHLVSENIPGRSHDSAIEFFEMCGGIGEFGKVNYLPTRYKFKVPSNGSKFKEALVIFGSMLIEAELERRVEHERKIIFHEFNTGYPFLEKLEWDMTIRKSLFKGHRLETWNGALGRPEGFLATTETDLQNYYDKYYVPANISVVVIGGLQTEQVIAELIRSPFGIVKDGKRNTIPKPYTSLPIPEEKSLTVKLSEYTSFKLEQTEYKAMWAFPIQFDTQALRVFDQMLEDILFNEIRVKRGLAYSIESDYTSYQDVYQYYITGSISPDATPYINELVKECIRLVPMRRDLFERKLTSLKQRCMMIDIAKYDLARHSATDLYQGHRIVTMKEVWDNLHKVTFEQVVEATKLLSSEQQFTFILCP